MTADAAAVLPHSARPAPAERAPGPGPVPGDPMDAVGANRFYMIALIFQRARQLHNGARPRVYKDGHKSIRLAHLEVKAGLISWELMAEAPGKPGANKEEA
jgi:DNA-directed RNA polymerase subunit K/omega